MNDIPAVPREKETAESGVPSGHDSCLPVDDQDLEVEMALLAISEDMGGPMEDVDLSSLSPNEKQALLAYLRKQLGLAPGRPESMEEEPRPGGD